MRFAVAGMMLVACTTASGCATALVGVATVANARLAATHAASSEFVAATPNYSTPEATALADEFAALAESGPGQAVDRPQPKAARQAAAQEPVEPPSEIVIAEDPAEVVPAPDSFEGPFKDHEDESDLDRFHRAVAEVPLDIRPTRGAMPTDLAAAEFGDKAPADPRDFHDVPKVVCSYTPWTICFRPLYFEEVCVERYGERVPVFQSAISGAHFFSSVALLPYKMRVRPPRSCLCSNGFSRCGDPMPPGYNDCVWRWDAALVEVAAVTGFVFILP